MFSESPDRPLHLMSIVQSDVSLLLIYYRRSPERSFNLAECGTAQNPVRHVLWTDKHLLAGPWHHCMISSWAMLLKADLSENHVWACPSPSFRRAASCSATDRLMLWCPTHFCSFSMFIWIFYIDTTSQENVMFCTRLQNRKKLYKNVWLKLCQTRNLTMIVIKINLNLFLFQLFDKAIFLTLICILIFFIYISFWILNVVYPSNVYILF